MIFERWQPNSEKLLDPQRVVGRVNELAASMEELSDDELKHKTVEFKQKIAAATADIADQDKLHQAQEKVLAEILPEAFAVVRETAQRTLGLRHYDEQIEVGLYLHQGQAVEMQTGEGKTLAATLAVYLNALSGEGVHVMTANDYLSARDAVWMASIYDFLGLSSGILQNATEDNDRPSFVVVKDEAGQYQAQATTRDQAYQADITYGTIAQFGFDYLRDSLVIEPKNKVQREHNFVVVDEVDEVLIDDASTPLFLAGEMVAQEAAFYRLVARQVAKLVEGEHFTKDMAQRTVELTTEGNEVLSQALGVELINTNLAEIYDPKAAQQLMLVHQALQAQFIFKKDEDYIVWFDERANRNKVVIINEGGRSMFGRSWSDGLHQAIEAKEGLPISSHDRTFDAITIQSYAAKYRKKSGMSGSLFGIEAELDACYGMKTQIIPRHIEGRRVDEEDLLYWDEESKLAAIKAQVTQQHQQERPILLGTDSILNSRTLAGLLESIVADLQVLDAYHHQQEADIISRAGLANAVMVATNMAGRGTDIKLTNETKDLGGLFVIGATLNRHERTDDQLRGRAGRQGDPGSSQFYFSLEDELLVRHAEQSSQLKKFLADNKGKTGLITGKDREKVVRFIQEARDRIARDEAAARKQLWEYSQVTEKHRAALSEKQLKTMTASENELKSTVAVTIDSELARQIDQLSSQNGEINSQEVNVFLTWLERMQPTTDLGNGELQPSFGLSLLIKKALMMADIDPEISLDQLSPAELVELQETLLELKQQLLEHRKNEVLKTIPIEFAKTNTTRRVTVKSLERMINLLIPGQIKIEPTADKAQLMNTVLTQVSELFDEQIEAVGTVAVAGGVMTQARATFLGETTTKVAPKQKVFQLAQLMFVPEGRVKSDAWWVVEQLIQDQDLEDIQDQVKAHLLTAETFNKDNWPGEVFDEDGELLTSYMQLQRKAILIARRLAWTEYLDKIEALQKTIELKSWAGGDLLTSYTRQANQLFEEMLNQADARALVLMFNHQEMLTAEESVDFDSGQKQLTVVGSYQPAVALEKVMASADAYPTPEQFVSRVDQLERAILAERGHVDTRRLFKTGFEDETTFSQALMKAVDRQVVVFSNYFVNDRAFGFDVAFSQQVIFPDKIILDDGKAHSVDIELARAFTAVIKPMTQQLALKRRFEKMLDFMQAQNMTEWFDAYEGITQNRAGVEDKIRFLAGEIKEFQHELWSYCQKKKLL